MTANGFRITTRDGSVWTVSVDGSTAYRFGTADGTLADVTAGATAVAAGTATGEDQFAEGHGDGEDGRLHHRHPARWLPPGRARRQRHDPPGREHRRDGLAGGCRGRHEDRISGRSRADGSIDADAIVAGNLRSPGRGPFGGPRAGADGARDDTTIHGGSTDAAFAPTF